MKEYLDDSDKKPVEDDESLKNHLLKQLNEIIDTNVIDTLKSPDIIEKLSNEFHEHADSQFNMQDNLPGPVLLSLPDHKDGQMDIKELGDKPEHDPSQISLEKEGSISYEELNQSNKADSQSEKEAKLDESFVSINNDNNNDTEETQARSDEIDENKEEDTIFLLADDTARDNIDEPKLNINEEEKLNTNEEIKSNINEEKSNTNEEINLNMSAEFPEDRDKKVQFSYDNFGNLFFTFFSILLCRLSC